MKQRTMLSWVAAAIAAITVVSGLVQMSAPQFVLGLIGGEITPTSAHFFGIVGMFMFLFGGALLHEVLSTPAQPIVALWAALQKFGAVAAVSLGVARHLFSPLALGVAGFDLISGIVIVCYWARIRRSS